MAITAVPLTEHIGAEIRGIDLSQPVDAATAAELYRLWLKHIVLLIRDQDLSQEQLVAATRTFGSLAKLARPAEFRPPGFAKVLDNIMLISNIRENGVPIGALPDGEMWFHHDMLHVELPHKGTCLYSLEVPSHGGNTLFANCYRAYETLPADLRERLENRQAFHSYYLGEVKRGDGKGVAHQKQSRHPIFRTHEETGRKAVYANRLMTERIDGLEKDESDQLLARLFDHSENKEWVYEHVWRPHDLLVWDNRCSMHARTDFPEGERRLMLRTTIEGQSVPV